MATKPKKTPAAPTSDTAPEGDDKAPAAAPEGADDEPHAPLSISAQYIKDLSFEAPTTPGIFGMMQQQAPDISININVNAQPLQENHFEVVLEIRAECKVGDLVAFIVELSYGGLFAVNVEREHLQPVLLIECPRMIFPFVRYIIADVTRDGGFPPLMMGPIDFVAMYQEVISKQEAKAPAKDS